MGENGAGKSTLMKILSGAYRPDPGGEIRIEGSPVRIEGPLGGRAAGISIIYQELSLAPNLSVAENIYLGRELSRAGLLARGAMREGVGPILKRLGADFRPVPLVHWRLAATRARADVFLRPDHQFIQAPGAGL